MSEVPPVLRERRDHTMLVTINWPDQRNAVNAAAVAASRGSRSARKPLIAAVEGFAVAGGLEIALSGDLIVVSGARLGIPESRARWRRSRALLRLARASANDRAGACAHRQPITAERAFELGLINRLSAPGEAVQMALELATVIATNGPLAVAASKRILTRVGRLGGVAVLRPAGGDRRARIHIQERGGGSESVRRAAHHLNARWASPFERDDTLPAAFHALGRDSAGPHNASDGDLRLPVRPGISRARAPLPRRAPGIRHRVARSRRTSDAAWANRCLGAAPATRGTRAAARPALAAEDAAARSV